MRYLFLLTLSFVLFACEQQKSTPSSATASTENADKDDFNVSEYTLESLADSDIQQATKRNAKGQLEMRGYVLNGQRTGTWMNYAPADSTRPKQIISYAAGKRNGLYMELNEAGFAKLVAYFKDDKLDGNWGKYNFGRPLQTAEYLNGELHGTSREYTLNKGELQKEMHYKNGKLDGAFIHYDDKGQVVLRYEYKDGEKLSGGIVNPKDTAQ